jgi:hypothetical protein
MADMEPKWYINKTTGLVILEDGGIVEWLVFKNAVPRQRLNAYLSTCNQVISGPVNKKRRRSITENLYCRV